MTKLEKKICDCRGWNWSNQGTNLKKLKVWWSIKNPNTQIKNQKSTSKMKMTLNFEVDDWVCHGLNCMKFRVWETITGAIKSK
jgi:hypothetical protein